MRVSSFGSFGAAPPLQPVASLRFSAASRRSQVPSIGVSAFVQRQTPQSRYSYFDGSWEELCALVRRNWHRAKPSPNKKGVMIVPVPRKELGRFYSGVVKVTTDTRLKPEFSARRPHEAPYIHVSALDGEKLPAQAADIIVYSHEALMGDDDAPPIKEADYYIISINARATREPEPMTPMAMARNLLGLPGGTKPDVPYTAEDFARAIIYWSDRTFRAEPPADESGGV